MRLIDRTGHRYGRLTVTCKDATPRMWLCRCDCGAEKLITGSNLASGGVQSCGCLAREWSATMGANPEYIAIRAEKATKHGHKRRSGKSVEYATWLGMKRRCYDTACKDYPRWGGRGIDVCDRWNDSFEAFLQDMGPRPPDKSSIDRLDGSQGYGPGNCRWATPLEQGETQRTNMRVSFDGRDFPSLRAACEELGLGYTTVWQRIKAGYSAADALAFGAERPPNTRSRESYLRKSVR